MKKRILVPTDFSEEANNALESARSLAVNTTSEILLLHVIEDPHFDTFKTIGEEHYNTMENVYVLKLIDVAKQKLESVISEDRFKDVNISYKVEIGKAYTTISEQIAEHGCSLVVMGTKGASGLQEILVGSNADKVVRFATCPVITVKECRDLTNIKHIVFATDLRPDQFSIIEELKLMQDYFGATLHIVKVYESLWLEEDEVKQRIEEFAKKANLENYTIHAVHGSDEAFAIMHFAADINAHMIALGAHDRHGLLYLLAGGISKDIVNHAKRPIWTQSIKE